MLIFFLKVYLKLPGVGVGTPYFAQPDFNSRSLKKDSDSATLVGDIKVSLIFQ